jgi:anti-sigma regulatory factor (Ser/Thr protein kinase)
MTDGQDIVCRERFTVAGRDFGRAGSVSTTIKSMLKQIGFPPDVIRRVAIATYEAEMNVVVYAERATVTCEVTPAGITVTLEDQGSGIADIEQAMQEGFSTATDEIREMGFGAGMGLPNMKRNADDLQVTSEVGVGTTVRIRVLAKQ